MKPWWMIKCKEEEDYEMIEEKKFESKLIKPFDFKSKYIFVVLHLPLWNATIAKKNKKEKNSISLINNIHLTLFLSHKKNLDNL